MGRSQACLQRSIHLDLHSLAFWPHCRTVFQGLLPFCKAHRHRLLNGLTFADRQNSGILKPDDLSHPGTALYLRLHRYSGYLLVFREVYGALLAHHRNRSCVHCGSRYHDFNAEAWCPVLRHVSDVLWAIRWLEREQLNVLHCFQSNNSRFTYLGKLPTSHGLEPSVALSLQLRIA